MFYFVEANELLEPEVIFKLSKVVIQINIIISFPVVHLLPDDRFEHLFDFKMYKYYPRY